MYNCRYHVILMTSSVMFSEHVGIIGTVIKIFILLAKKTPFSAVTFALKKVTGIRFVE